MRRKEKEIQDFDQLVEIINQSAVCRLGLAENNKPYIVPLSFGFKDKVLYFHSAREGRKIDILENNRYVCFEFETDVSLIRNNRFCNWGMKYKTVLGDGLARFINDPEEKMKALDLIISQYSDAPVSGNAGYTDKSVENIIVFAVDILNMTGKKSGDF